jgi:hypothetical protein
MSALGTLGQELRGRIRCQVLDAHTKEVVRDYGWQNNLILNQGMNNYGNLVYTKGWADAFLYCVAGTGSTKPNKNSSGATTAAQATTTVTLSGGSFLFTDTATDAGRMIKWDTLEEAMIVTVTDTTHAEVDRSQTVSAGTFVAYNTQLVGLETEVARTNNYVAGVGFCEFQVSPANMVRSRRTWDFAAEGGSPHTYTEIGFAQIATVAANLFSRVYLLTPIAMLSGQQLRIIYEIFVTYTPAAPRSKTASITNWPVAPSVNTDGAEAIETFFVGAVASNGQTTAVNSISTNGLGSPSYDLELAAASRIVLSTTSLALSAAPVPNALVELQTGATCAVVGTAAVASSYVANSFTRKKTWTFATTEANRIDWRCVAIGNSFFSTFTHFWSVFRFLFAQVQAKDNLHQLKFEFTWTWSRVLA